MSSPRVVLVTGAASGIGEEIARRFAEAGDAVAVVDIQRERAAAVASQLPRAIAIGADIALDGEARAAVEGTVQEFGRLHVLVNNAGIEDNGTVAEMAPEAWDRVIAVNLRGAYLLSRYAVPHLRGHGAILNIASVHAYVSWPRCPAYDATKAGLIGLTRAMALDHGREGIRVNAICPGYIETAMLAQWFASLADREDAVRQVIAAHPVGRMGTPRDIAEAAFFLASDAASFITGTSLVVDGGMTVAGH